MAGYDWKAGKSNNAVAAEKDGLMVASKLAAVVKRHRRFRGCTAADVAAVLPASEWHHSSKFFNEVNYYDPAVLLEEGYRRELAERIANRKRRAKLRQEAVRRGVAYLMTADGDPWYRLPDVLNETDEERLVHQFEHGHAEVRA